MSAVGQPIGLLLALTYSSTPPPSDGMPIGLLLSLTYATAASPSSPSIGGPISGGTFSRGRWRKLRAASKGKRKQNQRPRNSYTTVENIEEYADERTMRTLEAAFAAHRLAEFLQPAIAKPDHDEEEALCLILQIAF